MHHLMTVLSSAGQPGQLNSAGQPEQLMGTEAMGTEAGASGLYRERRHAAREASTTGASGARATKQLWQTGMQPAEVGLGMPPHMQQTGETRRAGGGERGAAALLSSSAERRSANA